MDYSKVQLFTLRSHVGNILCLVMHLSSGKDRNKIGSNASNSITLPITPYNDMNISICLCTFNLSEETSDVVQVVDVDAFVITHNRLSGHV